MGEVPSALIQNNGRIALDNRLMAIGDLAWPIILLGWWVGGEPGLLAVGFSYAAGQCLCFGSRSVAVAWITRMAMFSFRGATARLMLKIARFGSLISIAQLADFLYAPTDFILINRLLNPADVAIYAPAVQIDAGLLLLVGGMAAVLLPKTATAHTSGDFATVRRYYIRGTFTSIGLLVLSSLAVWIAARYLFFAWLGSEMRATQAILPLVLIHTVAGGSSAVGRSILLGMGKVKPFTIAVLIAGVSNVVLSYCFVKYLDLGLKGIVLGTVVVVLARCAIWQPWYVMRCLKSDAGVEPKRN
jgi:O-antigen/teichoic acid export membrane protein